MKYQKKLAQFFLAALIVSFGLLLVGCGPSSMDLWRGVINRSGPKGYIPVDLVSPPFHLAGLLKSGPSGGTLVIYLEGDGRAIIKGKPSSDPTPRKAQALDLALLDPAPSVLYLARIGQFMPAYATASYRDYWSDRRLAPEVVKAASDAIDQAKAMTGAESIHLLGYSGGGGLAVLLAESREDVLTLVTIAGLLDTEWWVSSRGYRPLTGSLNPADLTKNIQGMPQVHFFGLDDKIIPPEMSLVFSNKVVFSNLRRIGVDSDHYNAWTSNWKALLEKYILPLRLSSENNLGRANQDLTRQLFSNVFN
ncbi:MAG: hypothetical protein LBF22_07080 [Deltaproteobacteria bacterium]|jgi:pimeloyl-ACP methyl ester carboxylesterase|nr:hypothetical protein [Deltaproteobacteria bacterium]